MFNTTNQSEWFCTYEKHENNKIIGLCLLPECEQKRTTCLKCELEFHRQHSESLIDVSDLLFWRQEWQQNHDKRLAKIQSLIELLDQVKNQMTDLISNQTRIFEEFSKAFDSDIKTTQFSNLLDSGIAIKKIGSDDQMFDDSYFKKVYEILKQENLLLSLYRVDIQFKKNVETMQYYDKGNQLLFEGLKLIQKKCYQDGISYLDQAKKVNDLIFRSESYLQLKTLLCCNFKEIKNYQGRNLLFETIQELDSYCASDKANLIAYLQLSMLLIKSNRLEEAVDNIQWIIKILKQQNVDAFILTQRYQKFTQKSIKNEEKDNLDTLNDCWECIYFFINKPYSTNKFDFEVLDIEQILLILRCLKLMCDDILKNQKNNFNAMYQKVTILKMLGDYDTALYELLRIKDKNEGYFSAEKNSIIQLQENDKNFRNLLTELKVTQIIPQNEKKKKKRKH